MSGVQEQCPFCKSNIAPGATVCRGCGATKGRDGGRMLATLFAGGAYVLFGPFVVVLAIHSMSQSQTWGPAAQRAPYGAPSDGSMLVFGLVVTVVGGLFLRWCIRQCAQVMWFRQSP